MLDVGESNGRVGLVLLEPGWVTAVSGAGTTGNTGLVGISIGGVVGVEPQHADGVVSPDGHDKDVAALQRVAHFNQTAELVVLVPVLEDVLLVDAEFVGDGVASGDAGNVDDSIVNDNAVLDVLAADLNQVTVVGAVVGDELGNDSNLLGSVDGELGARSVEITDTHTEGVDVATVLVANAIVPLGTVTALSTLAAVLALNRAGVGGVSVGDLVGFPDVHLGTAGTVPAVTGVLVALRGVPSLNVGLTVDHPRTLLVSGKY